MTRKTYSNAQEQRKRSSLNASSPKLTDQSSKKSADINNIMLQYAKTGLLPVQKENLAQYIDNTSVPSLIEAHSLIADAQAQFMELPAQIRKLMDNDPNKLVPFIQDPENQDLLVKYKIIKPKKQDPETREPAAVEPKKEVIPDS